MCWNVDAETHVGVCVPMCKGLPEQAFCERGECVQVEALHVCAPGCDENSCTTGNACTSYGDATKGDLL
jgi:hypothetical protein